MRRNELGDLAAFVAVADELSFRTAAERLGVTPSALSHTIRQIEERHGVQLFNRTTRKVSLTSAGERLLGRVRPAMDEIAGAVQALDVERQRPFGRLSLLATPGAVPAVITPIWARYLAAYPDVQLEVMVDPGHHDLAAEGFDAAIGRREWAGADMIAVRVTGPRRGVFVASPAYLARRGQPRAWDDLARHNCIRQRGSDGALIPWQLEHKGRTHSVEPGGQIVVNDTQLGLQAALDGIGIALAVEWFVDPYLRSGQLSRVLDAFTPSVEGLYVYYPRQRHPPAALRALIDMIRSTSELGPARSRSG
jgi:DNA-binding transcriptional LysR family regulator